MTIFFSDTRPARQTLTMAIFLTAIALLVYSSILHAPFVFDDLPNIVQNPHIRLTELTKERLSGATRGPTPFRPVAYLTFAANYYLGGYDSFGYHLTSIAIHIAIALLLFLISGHTLRLSNIERGIIPELSALLWLAHPLNTQSVSYIVQRMNSLAALFFMLCLYLYLRARLTQRSRGTGRLKVWLLFSGCAVAGLLALFSKEIAATLPAVIFLYEWYFFQNLDRVWLKKKLRWIGITAAIGITIAVICPGGALLKKIAASYADQPFSPVQRLLTEPGVVIYYLSLLLFPHPARLNVDYDFPLSDSPMDPAGTGLALAAIAALMAAALYRPARHRLLSFAVLWFLGNLFIESSFLGLAIIFEHRTYLPSLFPVFIVTACLIRYLPRPVSFVALGLIVLISGIWTYQRNAVWGDTLIFWQDCAHKSPGIARPANGVGMAYQTHHQPEKALEWFQKAVRLDPDYDEAHSNIGGILVHLGRPAEAVPHFEQAIALNPESPEFFSNLGSAMQALNRLDDAIACYRKSLSLYPDYEIAHSNLGAILTEKGDINGALRHLNRAVRINPGYPEAYNNLGLAMMKLDRRQEAIAYYQQALRLNPEYAIAHFNVATAWFQQEDLDRARHHLQQAARLEPDSVLILNNLATVLIMRQEYGEAVGVMTRLAALLPDSPTAQYNLACVYALRNQKEEAVKYLKQAVDLGYDRWEHLRTDPDLKNIHDTDYFKKLTRCNVL